MDRTLEITGIPPLLLTFVTLRYLTDTPDQAGWLAPDERDWLIAEISREQELKELGRSYGLREAFLDRRVWLVSLAFFAVLVSFGGILYWMPQIIEEFSGAGDFTVSLLSAIPWLVACVGLVLVGRSSDRTGERRWHAAGPYFVGAAGLLLSTYLAQPVLALVGLSLVVTGIQSAIPGFWGLSTAFLGGTAAAGALALINSVGNLGGFVGPYLMGLLADLTGSQRAGLFVMALFLLAGATLILFVRPEPGRQQSSGTPA